MRRRKIFGIGWAKTGTTTLGACLKILGYRHISHRRDLIFAYANGDIKQIISSAKEADSFEDWPWILVYRELDLAYPDSLFVLTTRQPSRWLKSYKNMLARQGKSTPELTHIRRILYGLNFPSVTDQDLLNRYKQHNQDVINYFRNRNNSLLIVNWEEGDGWPELCNFIGVEAPFKSLPHENKGIYPDQDQEFN